MKDVRIYDMDPGNVEGKAFVHWQSWQETYAGLVDEDFLKGFTLEQCVGIAKRWPENTLIAEVGGRAVGFASYNKYRDDTLDHCGEVYALYVLRAFQGQGIGYALMQACLERLSKYPKIALWVLEGNEQAIHFYQRVGFALDGAQTEIVLGTVRTELRMVMSTNTKK